MSWQNDGYVVIKNAIPKILCENLSSQFRLFRDNLLYIEQDKFCHSDSQVKNSFSYYSFYGFEVLLDGLIKDIVKKETLLNIYPTYSYARIYYNNAEMEIHTDRDSCEISVTCCLDCDDVSWPIGFINRQGEKIYIHQEQGDIIIYSGCELKHWRDKYEGQEQVQVFLHYVNADGKYADEKYDKRPMLGLSAI